MVALYSLKKISLLAENRQAYLRGIGTYDAGGVKELTVASDPVYASRVTARVEEPSAGYQVEVGFDAAGEVEHIHCGCSRYRATHKACKHIVAALVHKYYLDMAGGSASTSAPVSAPSEDPMAALLIDRYRSARRVRLTVAEEDAPGVTLIPSLHLTGSTPTLTFAVGRDKPYLIKNLARFAGWMERGEQVDYGRDLTLLHHRDAFLPESRPLLDYLLAEVAALTAQPGVVSPFGVGELPLTGGAFDRFFKLMQGAGLAVFAPDGERRVTLTEGTPTLILTVEREGDGVAVRRRGAPSVRGAASIFAVQRKIVPHLHRLYPPDGGVGAYQCPAAKRHPGVCRSVAGLLFRGVGGLAPLRYPAGGGDGAGESYPGCPADRGAVGSIAGWIGYRPGDLFLWRAHGGVRYRHPALAGSGGGTTGTAGAG